MGINNTAYAYQQAEEFERRKIRVLDGRQAKLREDKKRADMVKVALAASAILFYLLAVTFMSAQVCSVGVEINELKAAIGETQIMTARAELELGQLTSLERVELYVAENLDMVYPTAGDIYFLDEQSSMAIAMEREQLQLQQSMQKGGMDEPGIWQAVSEFFFGTAKAAEN
jgi:cell division protein FtsL